MAEDGSGERDVLQQDLIARYRTLLDKLNVMLTHAESGRWAEIIEQESEYLAELERLRYLEAGAELNEAMQFHRARLGREILERSAELKRYLTERQEVLAGLIEQAEQHSDSATEATDLDAENSESGYHSPDPEHAKR